MVEILRYFIFFYCLLGIFIAGGLFFRKRSPANITLALYILLFTFEQLDFLYTTSNVVLIYPSYYLYMYPICFLFGPSLWLHLKFIKDPKATFKWKHLLHAIPFVLFIVIALLPLYQLGGEERIAYTRENFMNQMMPLNYIRTGHVTLYGVFLLLGVSKNSFYKKDKVGLYMLVIAVIYFVTAVLQVCLTLFADSFRQFSIFFFLGSSIFLIAGFVLYRYPEFLEEIQKKYFSNTLHEKAKQRIEKKITSSRNEISLFLKNNLKLREYSAFIKEKPHHVSQVFSENLNTSFSNFVNEIRVKNAASLLRDPKKDNLKILAIAFESGFNNNVTFNKAFVKEMGTTPGKYRKNRASLL
ncbi:helix-turn-helix domain-containing protein [Marinirhabdus gelatinilytica]|uniref:Helix-turn-helix protein n=1 Tax=Marinirhabdus gelatinilytica TaxID=1703343 RepID=A0A370QEU1_9FLAO|nr:helix-turn-helix domain-containing protein [Marinirhabdus gelatinilytica]RDK86883.1 helix-turn-helix protein [Marinirhabdus gelatinilytica]